MDVLSAAADGPSVHELHLSGSGPPTPRTVAEVYQNWDTIPPKFIKRLRAKAEQQLISMEKEKNSAEFKRLGLSDLFVVRMWNYAPTCGVAETPHHSIHSPYTHSEGVTPLYLSRIEFPFQMTD